MIAAYILLIFLSSLSLIQSVGIWRMFPFIIIIPAAATFFYPKKIMTAAICSLLAFIFFITESGSAVNALISAAAAFIFACAGIMVKRFIVTAVVSKRKRVFCLICGVILFVISAAAYSFVFGNPFSAFSAEKTNKTYISQTYGEDSPDINYTYYSFPEKRYFTNVSFTDNSFISADISAYEGEITDGYSNYYEYKFLSARRQELARLLSQGFPKEQCAIRINIKETQISLSEINGEKYFPEMVFDIAFYEQLDNESVFAEKCRQYHDFLQENEFIFKKINYYGGYADDFKFEAAADYEFDGEYTEIVKPFSEETFDRYYEELDYADHWKLGS